MKYAAVAFVVILAGFVFALIWSVAFPITHPVVQTDNRIYLSSQGNDCVLTNGVGDIVARWPVVNRTCDMTGHIR